jgi:PKD repeat protein
MIVNFNNKSLNATTVSWAFGDGGLGSNDTAVRHVYANAGTYGVVHYSYDSVGHVDSLIKFIEVEGPYATLSADTLYGCNGLQIELSADTVKATSFKWDFGDGTITSTIGTSAKHIYGTAGYITCRDLFDSAGCSATSAAFPANHCRLTCC